MRRISAGGPRATPALVAAWAAGWALARDFPAPVRFPGGVRVDAGTEAERVRYVLFGADTHMIAKLTAAETRVGAFIKVCAAADVVAPSLPPGWRMHGPQHLMTASMAASTPLRPLASGYASEAKTARPVLQSAIRDDAGRVVASGRLVLIGSYGIVDEVSTEPEHRRRGLATCVLADLMRMGNIAGAQTGILVATSDGYGLYAKMGWQVHAPYTSAYNF